MTTAWATFWWIVLPYLAMATFVVGHIWRWRCQAGCRCRLRNIGVIQAADETNLIDRVLCRVWLLDNRCEQSNEALCKTFNRAGIEEVAIVFKISD